MDIGHILCPTDVQAFSSERSLALPLAASERTAASSSQSSILERCRAEDAEVRGSRRHRREGPKREAPHNKANAITRARS